MKYAQIIAEIEQAIGDGALAPGDRLPSERELAAAHGVSRMTVRQALQALESRGVRVGTTPTEVAQLVAERVGVRA